MEEWKQRLAQARAAKGLSKSDFAKAVRISAPTATDWEKSVADGGIKEISGVRLAKACEVLGVDTSWLLSGKGSGPVKAPSADRIEETKPVRGAEVDDPAFAHIPKVRLLVSAGVTGFGVEPEPHDGSTATVPVDWLRRRKLSAANLIAIRVRGRSMEPTFNEGDTVFINKMDNEPADGAVFVINYEGEDVIKRLSRDAGDWYLMSDNRGQEYHRKLCKGAECIIIGRVVRSEREHY